MTTGTTSDPHDEYTPRQRLSAIKARAEIDAAYAAEVRANPGEALRAAGFTEGQAQALTTAQTASDNPAVVLGACFDTTCAISICPPTCVVSIPGIPGVCKGAGGGGDSCGLFSIF
ncbi:hypothetical protein ABT324_02320 [Saccharopolyspora sp. NPDC000359]|uniref:hypothetical protein n=1 Tax=Saccharopolyspora sp. NPDC000359 TaxID=3154251 RepID=UPI00332C3BE3